MPHTIAAAPRITDSASRARVAARGRRASGGSPSRGRHRPPLVDHASRGELDDRSPAVRCRAHVQSRAPCAGLRAARSRPRGLRSSGIDVRRRLVEHHQRARRTSARAMAMRCRWPAETARPPSPTTVSYPYSRSRMNASAPARRAASRTASKGARRTAEPDVVENRSAEERRALRHPRHGSAPRCHVTPARSTPPTVTRPTSGRRARG